MLRLIITIISIALIAALLLATLYYGGDAFNRGKVKVVDGLYLQPTFSATRNGSALLTRWAGAV